MISTVRLPCLAALCLGGCCLEAVGPSSGSAGRSSGGATGTAVSGTSAGSGTGSPTGSLSGASAGGGSSAAGGGTGTSAGTGGSTGLGTSSGGSTTGPACAIDGRFFASGTFDPADSAECCNPAVSKTAWIPVFKKTLSFPVGSANGVVDGTLGDLNADGVADMLLVTHTEPDSSEDAQAVVFLSEDGGFATPAVYPTAQAQGGGVTIGDLDGDGLPDLIVSTTAAVDVFDNIDAGRLRPQRVTFMPGCDAVGAPRAIDANSDGWLDVVVATQGCGRLVFANDGDGGGTLLPPVPIVGDSGRIRISTLLTLGNFDTNNSGYENLAGGDNSDRGMGLEWFDHTVSGMGFPLKVPDSQFVPVDLGAVAVGPGDALVATDGTSVKIYPPTDLGPTVPASYPIEDGGGTIAVGDIDGDGAPDLLIASALTAASGASTVDILLNRGDAGFGSAGSFAVPGSQTITRVAAGDLNGDGRVDMALVWTNGPWEVWINQCGPTPR